MKVIPYQPEHLETMEVQTAQEDALGHVDRRYCEDLKGSGEAYSLEKDGTIYCCVGLVPMWHNNGLVWAFLSKDARKYMITITRVVSRLLEEKDYTRLQTHVVADFKQGSRWMEMFGFKNEGLMKKYDPEGNDCYMYARVK